MPASYWAPNEPERLQNQLAGTEDDQASDVSVQRPDLWPPVGLTGSCGERGGKSMRRACAFKEVDVKRAVRAIAAAGLIATSVLIKPDGTIQVNVAGEKSAAEASGSPSWDKLTA